jgi:Mor family transcriptional regulator
VSISDKLKHKTLEIITKVDKGEKLIKLAKEYGVECATIYDIMKNRERIDYFMKNTVDVINLFGIFSIIRRFR